MQIILCGYTTKHYWNRLFVELCLRDVSCNTKLFSLNYNQRENFVRENSFVCANIATDMEVAMPNIICTCTIMPNHPMSVKVQRICLGRDLNSLWSKPRILKINVFPYNYTNRFCHEGNMQRDRSKISGPTESNRWKSELDVHCSDLVNNLFWKACNRSKVSNYGSTNEVESVMSKLRLSRFRP